MTSSVAVPEIDQQTRDDLGIACDCQECDDTATWVGTWQSCRHGSNTILMCDAHKCRAVGHEADENSLWECIWAHCIISLLSIEAL